MAELPVGKIDVEGIRGLTVRLAGRVITVEELKTADAWNESQAEVWSPANHIPGRLMYPVAMVTAAIEEVMERPAPVPIEQRVEALEERVTELENEEA